MPYIYSLVRLTSVLVALYLLCIYELGGLWLNSIRMFCVSYIPRLLEITFLAIVFRCGLGTESLFCGAITKVDRSRKFMDFTTSVSENMEMPMYGNISPTYSITYRSRHWLTARYDFFTPDWPRDIYRCDMFGIWDVPFGFTCFVLDFLFTRRFVTFYRYSWSHSRSRQNPGSSTWGSLKFWRFS